MNRNFNENNKVFCSLLLIVLFLSWASIIGYIFRKAGFSETNIVIIYILSVLLTARLTYGYFYGIMASVIATFTFNYFFTDPYFTFSVNDPSYIVTFIIMTITAIITSALTSKVKQSVIEAEQNELETRALYQLTNHLSDIKSMQGIAEIATDFISDMMECQAACLCFDENGIPEKTFVQKTSEKKIIHRETEHIMDIKHQIESLRTAYDEGEEFLDWPVYGQENILGIIRIPKERAEITSEAKKSML